MSRPGVTVLEEETSAKGLPAYTLNSGFFLPVSEATFLLPNRGGLSYEAFWDTCSYIERCLELPGLHTKTDKVPVPRPSQPPDSHVTSALRHPPAPLIFSTGYEKSLTQVLKLRLKFTCVTQEAEIKWLLRALSDRAPDKNEQSFAAGGGCGKALEPIPLPQEFLIWCSGESVFLTSFRVALILRIFQVAQSFGPKGATG